MDKRVEMNQATREGDKAMFGPLNERGSITPTHLRVPKGIPPPPSSPGAPIRTYWRYVILIPGIPCPIERLKVWKRERIYGQYHSSKVNPKAVA